MDVFIFLSLLTIYPQISITAKQFYIRVETSSRTKTDCCGEVETAEYNTTEMMDGERRDSTEKALVMNSGLSESESEIE